MKWGMEGESGSRVWGVFFLLSQSSRTLTNIFPWHTRPPSLNDLPLESPPSHPTHAGTGRLVCRESLLLGGWGLFPSPHADDGIRKSAVKEIVLRPHKTVISRPGARQGDACLLTSAHAPLIPALMSPGL